MVISVGFLIRNLLLWYWLGGFRIGYFVMIINCRCVSRSFSVGVGISFGYFVVD